MIAAGEADAVVVAGCDSVTDSLLAVIGRGSPVRSSALRPFDADREGVLLGEGAAAVVLEPEEAVRADGREVLAVLRGVGLSCDAHHETAPDPAGIAACMRDAHERAGVAPEQVDLVLTHGTGTALNDPAEASALLEVFGSAAQDALVTGIKGAIGHTSGAAAVMALVVAVQAMRAGVIPAIWGLATPIPETRGLGLVDGPALAAQPVLAQVDAFGFGGVNAVAVVGAAL
jgi:3-oxoacyl-[acyl-carrier-protein] synthase II